MARMGDIEREAAEGLAAGIGRLLATIAILATGVVIALAVGATLIPIPA